jgi:hypothetical protein
MATQTTVLLIDDLDGKDADQTVTFAVDGVEYEIDLHSKNATAMRKAFEPYTNAGRRIGGRKGAAKPTSKITQLPDVRPSLTKQERASIRKFAAANGYGEVSTRGRIANAIQKAWVDAGRPM